MSSFVRFFPLFLFIALSLSCSGPSDAPNVQVPVVIGSITQETTNDLGYKITLSSVVLGARNFEFSVAGEAHTASLLNNLYNSLISTAYAHPGHFTHGEVTGELKGDFTLQWPSSSTTFGEATLLLGNYTSGSFSFSPLQAKGFSENQSISIKGLAEKDGESFHFSFAFVTPRNEEDLEGIPARGNTQVTKDYKGPIRIDFVPQQQPGIPGAFDSIDFKALAQEIPPSNEITLHLFPKKDAPETLRRGYGLLRNRLFSHDYYQFSF